MKVDSRKTWKAAGNTSLIKQWASDLGAALTMDRPANYWRINGRAVMLIHPSSKTQRTLIDLISEESGLPVVQVDGAEFMKQVSSGQPPSLDGPSIIHIPQGDWSKDFNEEEHSDPEICRFQENLSEYLSNIETSLFCIFITTGQKYTDLAEKIRTVGCFDRRFVVPPLSLEQLGYNFLSNVGEEFCSDSLKDSPGKVGKVIDEEFDDERRQGLVALAMQRRAIKDRRKLDFVDLVYFALHGTGEFDSILESNVEMLRRVAIHEAGHAVMCIVDSAGLNIPDYLSIIPNHQFRGIATDSYSYMESLHGRFTYEDSCHKVRTILAGRVAESIVLGPTNAGTFGARSDLLSAAAIAKEIVGLCGFPPDLNLHDHQDSNLLVIDESPTSSQIQHIENAVRLFLKNQYGLVKQTLEEEKELLLEVSDNLIKKMVLTQNDLLDIYCKTN